MKTFNRALAFALVASASLVGAGLAQADSSIAYSSAHNELEQTYVAQPRAHAGSALDANARYLGGNALNASDAYAQADDGAAPAATRHYYRANVAHDLNVEEAQVRDQVWSGN